MRKGVSVRRQVDDFAAIFFDPSASDGCSQRFWSEHHARFASVGRIVHLTVVVDGEVPKVYRMKREQSVLLRPADNGVLQRGEHFGENGDAVDFHFTLMSKSLARNSSEMRTFLPFSSISRTHSLIHGARISLPLYVKRKAFTLGRDSTERTFPIS